MTHTIPVKRSFVELTGDYPRKLLVLSLVC